MLAPRHASNNSANVRRGILLDMENQIHQSLAHKNPDSNHLLNSQALIDEEFINGCVKREDYTEEGDLEELVSSTTAPQRGEGRKHTSSNISNSDLKRREHKTPSRVETVAATSTTSFQDDEERLQMQKLGRGRKLSASNDVRPPSCGTPLGKIKEEGQTNMKHSDAKENLNDYDYARPSGQTPGNSNISNSNLADNVDGSFSDRKLINAYSPHAIRNNPSMFESRQNQPLHNPSGITGSPLFSDVSLIPLSPQPMVPGGLPFNRTSPLEFYLRGLNSPTMSMISQGRNISPRHSIQELEKLAYPFYGTRQDNLVTGNALSNQGMSPLAYYQLMQQQRLLAAAAENRNLAMSIEKQEEMARFASPFGRSRKRPLSKSPSVTDSMDLTAMIRTSPNSLLPLVNGCLSNSRSSSVASGGSYGHLAAGGISPTLGYPMMTSPSPFLFQRHPMSQAFVGPMIPNYNSLKNTLDENPMINPHSNNNLQRMANQNMNSNLNYHPPVGAGGHMKNHQQAVHNTQTSQKKIFNNNMEHPNQHSHYNTNNNNNHVVNRNNNNMNMGISTTSHTNNHNDENDVVYETNCNWENCASDFDSPEQLVQHINNDHIHGDKKEFVCRWRNCAREQRPFKAQYMLVVHMRRHTGEKPHRCTFTGCNKAYSRLENLKTHLRSHTGEKPYMCEYTGCTKAFSNASDRAKHQNRTHSNAKPYACKISGCTKCYTDPSSLRKHVKTVHGPEAHVTKRMRAEREREEKTNNNSKIKQEPGTNKKSGKGNNTNCLTLSPNSNQHHDNNPSNNMNPRSNQSTCTSGSDVSMTPQNSPNMTSQNNNDSGVDVNVGGNEGDSDGDIVVDENPLPDSTSGGGVGVQSRRRSTLKRGFIPTIFNKKMQNLNISGINRPPMGDFLNGTVEEYNTLLKNRQKINRNTIGGGVTEVSSTTNIKNKIPPHHPFTSLPQDRRDSGAISDASRKSSMTSQTSRRSSQVSNARVNVVGSYDPISLDGSRRTSSISQGVPHSGSNPQAIDPNDLHFLRSQFNERMGMPPPTPIDRDSYSKTQMAKWLNEDHQQGAFPTSNQSRAMLPPQPPFDPNNRRRSDGNRQQRNSMTGGNSRNGYRRASDPVTKVTQGEPGPSNFQRYNSWNNVAPLPGIRNQSHNGANQFGPHYNPGYQNSMQMGRNRSDSNGSFYSSESGYHSNGSNLALNQQQPNYSMNHPQGGVNEQLMMENMNADIAASNSRNEMTMRHFNNNCAYTNNCRYQDNSMPSHPHFNGANNQNPAMRGQGMSHGPQNNGYYNNKPYREDTPHMYRQQRQMSTPNIQQQQMALNYQQQQASSMHPVNVGYSQQAPQQLPVHYNNHAMQGPNLTPRPPPAANHSSPIQNQMRLARIRSANGGDRNVPQSSRTPEVQIPEEFLQQDFIESLTAPQPSSDFNANENASYVKMPADSTTGPDGSGVDNTDGAESTITNSDVTLPSMSAFSSRLTTPVMNKPYAPHHSMVNGQHPSSNMAINSMSSMLSALEEENKYLFPQ